MKRSIVLIALAAMVAASLPATAWAWGSAHPDSSDDYINRRATTFRGHELMLHDALLMLKSKRLIPASLGETYLQSMYYSPFYVSNATTSQGYKYLIKGARLADYDITVPYTGWNIPWISSAEHYYDPLVPFLSDPIIGFLAGGFNAKTAFMVYINGGTITAGIPGNPSEIGAIQRFKNGDITGGFQALGYAIHYLQDMSMPYHATPYHALTTVHGPVDGRGDTLIYNERLQFEKDALERWLPNNDLSFANDEITNKSMRGNINSIMRSLNYNHSQNLDDFIHAAAKEASSTIQYIDPYWFPPGFGPTNWTQIENQIRPLMKRNEERIAQLIFYVFWKAGMYPTSVTTNRDFAHPNTAFLRVWVPTNYKVTGIIDAMGPGGYGTILLNRCWANDNLTIKSGAGIGKRSTITLVGRDGRKISENTGPYGGEAVLNTSNGSNTGWYTVYVTSPDITSGTGNVYVNVYNNLAKDVVNSDPNGKEPPQMKTIVASGGNKTGTPPVGAAKGESPSASEIGYNVGQMSGRYYINSYSYDTDLFWTDMSYSYSGYTNAVMVANCLRFDNFYYDHRIDWKWYRPDGVLYNTCGPTYIYGMQTTGYTWNWWDVWAGVYLKWNGYDYWMQNYQGVWRQEVYIDNVLYTTQYFGVNAPPTITNIANGAYINGGPLEIGTSLKGVPNYASVYLDGTGVEKRVSLDYAAPYSGVVNASILADGAHTAYAYVSSGTPHSAGSKWTPALSFTVDKTKPTVSITAPADGSLITPGSVVTLSASASDGGSGIAKVEFYANDNLIATVTASPYNYSWSVPSESKAYVIKAQAYDRAGNTKLAAIALDHLDDFSANPETKYLWYGSPHSWGSSLVQCSSGGSPYYTALETKNFNLVDAAVQTDFTIDTDVSGYGTIYLFTRVTPNTDPGTANSLVGVIGSNVGNGSWDGIFKTVSGGWTKLSSASYSGVAKPALGTWHAAKLRTQNDTTTLYLDGVVIATAVDAAVRNAGDVSVQPAYGNGRIDNLRVVKMKTGISSKYGGKIGNKFPPMDDGSGSSKPVPSSFALVNISPNPVIAVVKIEYQLPKESKVAVAIYNISGQLVKTLVNETKPAGYHSVSWDSKDERGNKVAAGVYLYRLDAGNYSATRKMTVLR